MQNRDAVYVTQMDQDSYIQYYNTTPSDHHYMLGHNEPMSIIQQQQHGNNASHNHNSSSHPYNMAPANKSVPNNGKMLTSPHADMVGMNQPTPYSMNHMIGGAGVAVHGASSQMMQTDQNRFCKNTSSPPNHYEAPPPPMGPYHQAPGNIAGNHHSPGSNHFVDVSSTLTHISDTDNSPGNYVPTPPPMAKNTISMISASHSFQGLNCSMSDWGAGGLPSSISSNNSHNNCNTKNSGTTNNSQISQISGSNMQHPNEHHFSYLEPRNPDYVAKVTSTPAKPMSPPKPFLVKAPESHKIEKNHFDSISGLVSNKKGESLIKNEQTIGTKRHLVIFKVIEQVLDPVTKNVLKETVIKNEQLTIPVEFSSYTGSGKSESVVCSSGFFSDVSNPSSNDLKNQSKTEDSKAVESTKIKPKQSKLISNNNNLEKSAVVIKKKNVETEKSEAATALLSLHTIPSNSNTPVKIESINTIKTNTVKETKSVPEKPVPVKAGDGRNEDLMTDDDSNETPILEFKMLKPGVKVLAKWKDKNFYPAQIVKQCENHRWTVRFEDMATRNLFESEIIHMEHLFPKQAVMVKISDDLYKLATIMKVTKLGHNNCEFDLKHFHEDDKTMVTKRYPLKDLFLNAEQGAVVLNKVSKPSSQGAVYADVDLDNIVSGKRSRSIKSKNAGAEATAVVAGTVAGNGKPSQDDGSNSDTPASKKRRPLLSDTKDSPKETVADKSRRNIQTQSNIHTFGDYHENSLSFSPVPSKSIAATTPKSELENVFGPIPESGSKLFQNILFTLTCGYHNSLYESNDSKPEGSTPFDKHYLTKQIVAGSGKVFESFDDMKPQSGGNSECICIADTYSRSVKFLQCLAAGIPIISHQWVIECCRQNQVVDRNSYILPSGYSLITNALSSDKNTFKKSSVLFKGVKFYFGTEFSDKLRKLWSPVLSAAQAKIVQCPAKSIQRGQIDIIIGDPSCPVTVVERAKQQKIPIVSSEYVVQCLINGRKLPYDACPAFSYLKN